MTPRGAIACAHARIRACRSRLLTRFDALPLFGAKDSVTMQRIVAALDLTDPEARLARVYRTAIRGYRHAVPLLEALRGLRVIEDVKLQWRKAVRAEGSLLDLAERLDLPIATTIARAHGSDIAAAELAFDRWATGRLLGEARRLPRREHLARRLMELVVRERDAQLATRGPRWYGVSATPRSEDVTSLRRERLRLCRRAFVGSPFLLAPALAVILLAEEEVRAVRALVEREGDESLDAPLERALAGSQLAP